MATQQVTEKIIADAKGEAQGILDHHEKEAKDIAKAYHERIAEKKTLITTEAEAAKKTEHMRLVSQKTLAFNKEIVAEKRQHVSDIVKEAIKKLPEHKQYFSFLKAMITDSGQKEGTLVISKQDSNRFGKQLEKFLRDNHCTFQIETNNEMHGGVVIKKGKIVFHGSLAIISELLKDELTIAVAKKLF